MQRETTKILSIEHQNILKAVDRMNDRIKNINILTEIDKKFFIDAIDFIRNYADKFHHAKEEDILFKEFNKAAEDGCVHCNPVEQMLVEHEYGREFVKKIEEGVKNNDLLMIKKGVMDYIALIQEHIFKEDNILYPMADSTLSEKTEKKMLEKFKNIEKENSAKNKKYLRFING